MLNLDQVRSLFFFRMKFDGVTMKKTSSTIGPTSSTIGPTLKLKPKKRYCFQLHLLDMSSFTVTFRLCRPPWQLQDEDSMLQHFHEEVKMQRMDIKMIRKSPYYHHYLQLRQVNEKQLMNKLQYLKTLLV